MKKFLIITVIVKLFFFALCGEKICNLYEVQKLKQLVVNGDNAYLVENSKVNIFSVKGKIFLKSFGRKGEGPGEFSFVRNFIVNDNHISIDSQNKVLFFKKNGQFIKEIRKNPNYYNLIPVGDNYIGYELDTWAKNIDRVLVYYVFDSNLKIIKEIGNNISIGKMSRKIVAKKKFDSYLPPTKTRYCVYEGNIYLGDPESGIHFKVFNQHGNLVRTINGDYKKIKIPKEYKKEYMDVLKARRDWEEQKAKKNFIFREFFPAYQWFNINNNLIYLFTFESKDDRRKCMIVNMEGKTIGSNMVKYVDHELWSIYKDCFYFVIDNESTDVWELHREKLF